MSDYALSRTRSAALVRSSSVASRPVVLTRTYSVPDLTSYVTTSARYRPTWPTYYSSSYGTSYYPYRYYRDYSLYDDYWYDRYRYFSPLYYNSLYPRRYYYSDNLPNPYYWSYPTYWARYKSLVLFSDPARLPSNYWNTRFKRFWRTYTWDSEFRYTPSNFNRPSLQYFIKWS
ncbi:hypothetical protein M3Y94_00328500 [Aphelenchoides besseyi]|nr:hypothetical protein M3Y94_00328500 [Aphelenchoides besseyi]